MNPLRPSSLWNNNMHAMSGQGGRKPTCARPRSGFEKSGIYKQAERQGLLGRGKRGRWVAGASKMGRWVMGKGRKGEVGYREKAELKGGKGSKQEESIEQGMGRGRGGWGRRGYRGKCVSSKCQKGVRKKGEL